MIITFRRPPPLLGHDTQKQYCLCFLWAILGDLTLRPVCPKVKKYTQTHMEYKTGFKFTRKTPPIRSLGRDTWPSSPGAGKHTVMWLVTSQRQSLSGASGCSQGLHSSSRFTCKVLFRHSQVSNKAIPDLPQRTADRGGVSSCPQHSAFQIFFSASRIPLFFGKQEGTFKRMFLLF